MQTGFTSLLPKIALSFFALFMIVAMAAIVIFYLRQELVSGSKDEKKKRASLDDAFVLAGYDSVVKRVKEQEREMERLRKSEKESKTFAGRLTDSVLQAMNAGLIQFNPLAIIRIADKRSRDLLGYASPTGMHARDVFKGVVNASSAKVERPESSATTTAFTAETIVVAVQNAAKVGGISNTFNAVYRTPSGEQRKLYIAIFPLAGDSNEAQGAGCVLTEAESTKGH